jgi:hypothetical protein
VVKICNPASSHKALFKWTGSYDVIHQGFICNNHRRMIPVIYNAYTPNNWTVLVRIRFINAQLALNMMKCTIYKTAPIEENKFSVYYLFHVCNAIMQS